MKVGALPVAGKSPGSWSEPEMALPWRRSPKAWDQRKIKMKQGKKLRVKAQIKWTMYKLQGYTEDIHGGGGVWGKRRTDVGPEAGQPHIWLTITGSTVIPSFYAEMYAGGTVSPYLVKMPKFLLKSITHCERNGLWDTFTRCHFCFKGAEYI